MYSKNNKHWFLGLLVFIVFAGTLLGQQVKLNAGQVMRPGLSSVISLNVVRKDITGPVQCTFDLPQDWRLDKYYTNDLVRVEQKGTKATLSWLEFPMMDTLSYDVQVYVPQDQAQNTVQIGATLYYFNSSGKLIAIRANDISVRVMKYFSRY
jgi:hypothetical protein